MILLAKASVALLLSSLVNAQEELLLPQFSLNAPYIDENLNNRFYNFGGDALVQVNEHVRLTQDKPSQRGWIWSRTPLSANSWKAEFEFKVHGTQTGLYGDGFAFWYTTDKEQEGNVFGARDNFNGLGVFFDTYANGRHRHGFPYISAMVGDGVKTYDHDNDGKKHEIAGCPCDFRGTSEGLTSKVKIKYIRGQFLQVEYNIAEKKWKECFLIGNVTLPTLGYIGFSSFTGGVSDNHDIFNVKVWGIESPHHYNDIHYSNHLDEESAASGAIFGILKFLFFVGIIGAIAYGIHGVMNKNKQQSYKRF